MKVLLDHCVPRPLRRHLPGHAVKTAYQMGWDLVRNGDLIRAAGEEAMNAPMVRCYGWRKRGEEPDPKNIVYF